jgi:hypothetical protein
MKLTHDWSLSHLHMRWLISCLAALRNLNGQPVEPLPRDYRLCGNAIVLSASRLGIANGAHTVRVSCRASLVKAGDVRANTPTAIAGSIPLWRGVYLAA